MIHLYTQMQGKVPRGNILFLFRQMFNIYWNEFYFFLTEALRLFLIHFICIFIFQDVNILENQKLIGVYEILLLHQWEEMVLKLR